MSNTNDMDTAAASPEDLEILAHWMEKERQARFKSQQIEPRQTKDNPPLSFAQERLWFLDQLEPGSSAYVVPSAIKLKGKLDIEALRRSLQEIVDRHEILRTAITMQDGEAVQDIKDTYELEMDVDELSAFAEAERSAMLKRYFSENALQPFDLATGRMIRCRLLRLGEDEHILMFSMHHIVTDGWSFSVLFRELAALYTAFCHGRPSPLPELPIQYADYAAWQRRWLHGEVLQAQLDYWTRQLEGISNLQLPTDRPRPAVQTYSGAYATRLLDKALARQLEEINRQHNATSFMTLLSAFCILLKRYCGQDDIVVGTPVANRKQREIEELIGFFVNTLVMRTDVSANPTFGELLNRVKQVAVDAYQHQDLPFETLVDELQPERDRSRNPLFQVLFAVQNAPSQNLSLEGLILEDMPVTADMVRFDLEMHISQKDETLRLVLAYNTDLFDAATIERILLHYQRLLASIVENQNQPVGALQLLLEDEYRQIVYDWNETAVDYPREQTVATLFEAQAGRTPDAIAVEYHSRTLSYHELNRKSNRLAHYLRAEGVGPGTIVGICVERGLDMVTGLLAILKAGGAYLPLDPAYPAERLRFMLTDSGAGLLLGGEELPGGLEKPETRVVSFTRDAAAIEAQSDANLAVANSAADDLAYLIYTSGSTGRPKGVQIPHRALVNFLNSMAREPGLDAGDVLLGVTTLSFDIAGLELYLPLIRGARLVLASREQAADGQALANLLNDNEITVMQATPASWRLLLEAGWEGKPDLKVICGGEALPPDLADALLARCGELWNLYGPTETTIWSTQYRIVEAGGPVLIGRPIDNTRIYLLDNALNPVPVGACGDMYIGGAGLAVGYLNRPELTAERFIADPFSDDTGARMYKTGDLARYRADGSIEYLGRADGQVKLRGFRIELGEIEAVIMKQADVKDCVVIVREDQPGDERLVAYVIMQQGAASSQDALRQHIRGILPEYMVPSAIVFLEALPLTPSGKVDRKALPRPQAQKRATISKKEPATEMEIVLAKIWQDLLDIDDIETDETFFDLGGHSLLTLKVVDRFARETGIRLPVASFMTQTLRQLAASAEAAPTTSDEGPKRGILGFFKRRK